MKKKKLLRKLETFGHRAHYELEGKRGYDSHSDVIRTSSNWELYSQEERTGRLTLLNSFDKVNDAY